MNDAVNELFYDPRKYFRSVLYQYTFGFITPAPTIHLGINYFIRILSSLANNQSVQTSDGVLTSGARSLNHKPGNSFYNFMIKGRGIPFSFGLRRIPKISGTVTRMGAKEEQLLTEH